MVIAPLEPISIPQKQINDNKDGLPTNAILRLLI